jgi:hypothetical protein
MAVPFQIELHRLDGKATEQIETFSSIRISQPIDSAWDCAAAVPPTKENRDLLNRGYRIAVVKSNEIIQFIGYLNHNSTSVGLGAHDLQITAKSGQWLLQNTTIDNLKLNTRNRQYRDYIDHITADYQPDIISSIYANNAATHYYLSGKRVTRQKTVNKYDPYGFGFVIGKKKVSYTTYTNGGQRSQYYKGIQEKVNNTHISPGTKIWDVITRFGKQIGIHPFYGPDKSLGLCTPNYSLEPDIYGEGIIVKTGTDGLIDPGKSTVTGAQLDRTNDSRAGEYIVYGQGKGAKTSKGKEVKFKTVVRDPSLFFNDQSSTPPYLTEALKLQETITVPYSITKQEFVDRIARTEMESRALGGFSYDVTIPELYSPSGVPYFPDSMVPVWDEYNNVLTPMYIKSVEKTLDMSGYNTVLHLMPPDVWLADVPQNADDYTQYMMEKIWW